MQGAWAWLCCAAVAARALGGCASGVGGYQRVVVEQTRQSAVLPALRGPTATGPMLAPGRFAVEGSLTTGLAGERPGAGDAVADQQTVHTYATARGVYATSHGVELGLSFEGADGRWSRPSVADASPVPQGALYLAGGAQVRAVVAEDEVSRFGVVGEFGVLGGASTRQLTVERSVPYRGSFAWGSASPSGTSPVTSVGEPFVRDFFAFRGAVGLFAEGALARAWRLGGSTVLQLVPYAARRDTTVYEGPCTAAPFSVSRETDCSEGPLAGSGGAGAGLGLAPVWTSSVYLSWTGGRWTAVSQLHMNVSAASGLGEASRFGGTLGVRFAL